MHAGRRHRFAQTGRWRSRRLAACGFLFSVLLPLPAGAGEVAFVASVDRTEVGLNDRLVLTLSVDTPDLSKIEKLQLPDTGTLQVIHTSEEQSTAFSFSGGGQSFKHLKNVILVLKPTKEGNTSIGAASLRYGGKSYSTDPINIRVVKASAKPAPQPRRRPPTSPFGISPFIQDDDDFFKSPLDDMFRQREQIGENDVFLDAHLSPDAVVEGQQTTISLVVYTRISARVASIRWPKLDGFFAVDRDVTDAKVDQKYINGENYQFKLLDQKALFPLQPGEAIVEPIEVVVELSTSPFFPAESRTLHTRPLKVQVLELPKEGRPASFHKANVGRFTLSAAMDSNEVTLNQPVTFTLTVRGSGNILQVRPPELVQLDRFKRFDPTVDVQSAKKGREVKGSKTFEYILVPLASGELTIPSLEFSFFDPEEGKYRTLRTDPQVIKVAQSQGATAASNPEAGREVNILAGAFKPIRYESSLMGYGPAFYRQGLFIPLLAVPPALYLLVVAAGLARSLVHTESPRSRARRAAARARARLKKAAALSATGQAAGFFTEMKGALLDAVEARCGLPVQGMLLEEMLSHLGAAGVAGEVREGVVREIENCDFGRFAPATSRGDEMQASLARATRILKELSRGRPHRETRAGLA